jgi:hypothetical protein
MSKQLVTFAIKDGTFYPAEFIGRPGFVEATPEQSRDYMASLGRGDNVAVAPKAAVEAPEPVNMAVETSKESEPEPPAAKAVEPEQPVEAPEPGKKALEDMTSNELDVYGGELGMTPFRANLKKAEKIAAIKAHLG